MRAFWPAAEAAQAEYEMLRAAALRDEGRDSVVVARFARRGLAGLIAWPTSEPVFAARLVGAMRPPWTPHADPRLDALAGGYELLVATPATIAEGMEVSR